MLIYLPDASEDIQNKAFEYANTILSDPKQLELIPKTAPYHALLGNPEGRPSTYQELRNMQLQEERITSYSSHDFASVNSEGKIVGLMGYNTKDNFGKIFGFGPWLGQLQEDKCTAYNRDIIAIYDIVINNTHETWVSVFWGEYNLARQKENYRQKDGRNGFERHVIHKYEKITSPVKMVYETLIGNVFPTVSVILKGKLA